jgi:hypothetical protein
VGAVSGLPQLHFVTGKPNASTSTAVPAWSTAGISTTVLPTMPWFVTSVSVRRIIGVNVLI